MKTIKKFTFATLAALAVTLLLQTSRAIADNSAPVRLTFEKTYAGAGPAPYVSHFTGSFGGDFTGTLYTGVLVRQTNEQGFHLEADYVFTADDGNHSFTAHVEGNLISLTGKALLNGVVTVGSLKGAQAQVEFEKLTCPTTCYQGTMTITPLVTTIRASQVEVCWNSQANLTYQVQYRSDLTTNLWTSLVGCVPGNGSLKCINDPVVVGQPQRFYRVVQTNCVP